MNYRLMFTINAVAVALFGVAFLIFPTFLLAQFQAESYVIVPYLSRFFGGTLILAAWFLWMLKDMANAKLQRSIALVLFAYSVAGFVLAIMGMTSIGVLHINGWVWLVIYGVFTLIYGYMLFLQPKEQKQRAPAKKSKGSTPSPDNAA